MSPGKGPFEKDMSSSFSGVYLDHIYINKALTRHSPCFGWVKNANNPTFVQILENIRSFRGGILNPEPQ